MTPTLMDVVMITGLDITSPSPSAYNLPEVPFSLSSKSECTNWAAYLNQHVKTKGHVTEREHTAFLNFWLEHFIFCGPSLAPTKNYLSLAYELAKCYILFDDLHIPIPVDLSFTFSINGFETWWSMWKDHIFWKALGPMLQQIDAEYEASEGEIFPPRTLHDLLFNFSLNYLSLLQQQDGPELEHDELSFSYLSAAPVVLFCKNAPSMLKIILDRQPDCSKLAFKWKRVLQAVAPELRSRGGGSLPGGSRKRSYHLLWTKRLRTLIGYGFAL
jgi:hypothetical protein